MIVADSYIFVHNPKTGGQSVSAALVPGYSVRNRHTPLYAIPREGRFAFGFVRDPWARMVSLYRFHCQKMPTRNDS